MSRLWDVSRVAGWFLPGYDQAGKNLQYNKGGYITHEEQNSRSHQDQI